MQSLPLNWQFHHIGIAVWDIAAARKVYTQLGFDCSDIFQDPVLNVKLVFCRGAGTVIELVAPVDDHSPCMFYLKRLGPGTYHTCYSCNNLEASLEQLKAANIKYKVVSKPTMPANKTRLIFLLIPTCGLIELIENKNLSI